MSGGVHMSNFAGLHFATEFPDGYVNASIYSITGIVGYAFGSYVPNFLHGPATCILLYHHTVVVRLN
jgi:hypothetical protein